MTTDLDRIREMLIAFGIKFKESTPYDRISGEDIPGTRIIISEDFTDDWHQKDQGLRWIGYWNFIFGFDFDENGKIAGYGAWE